MRIKELLQRFKQWQHKPVDYKFASNDVQHCNNCGNDFTGNFCPYCSQRSGIGEVSWRSVQQSVMDVWGLGSRSLPYTAWQLFLRPGYLIDDYINGKRQMSFPPVKMFFIVALFYSLLAYWLFPEVLHMHSNVDLMAADTTDELSIWYRNHFSWMTLALSFMAILPTWVMFRYSPRNTRHTFPKGFFIQVFFQIISTILAILFIPFNYFKSEVVSFLVLVILAILNAVYYIIGYMQLFGYGIWGTIWRQGFVLLCGLLSEFIFLYFVVPNDMNSNMKSLPPYTPYLFLLATLVILAIGHVTNLIAIDLSRRWQAYRQKRKLKNQCRV